MIKEILIKNFKSVDELTLELGRFNVLIGENGSGKTNILEAIAFGGAAEANKLDNEFLTSRGIRVTGPEFMRAAFSSKNKNKDIFLKFILNDGSTVHFTMKNDNKPYSKWVYSEQEEVIQETRKFFDQMDEVDREKIKAKIGRNKNASLFEIVDGEEEENVKAILQRLRSVEEKFPPSPELSNFLIYSPENTSLRVFEREGQILPLGIKGEGLFKLVKNFLIAKSKKSIKEIKEHLKLVDWFEDFELPEFNAPNEFVLKIKDRFLDSQLNYFDQRSSNEGFLFLLFYLALFISENTPRFFAVDNLEASFNPKLCAELSRTLARLSKKHKKQVIVTTQNPSILDGINLNDPEERLFVIKRNTLGYTIAKRITAKPEPQTPVKLSEAWTRGYIGGLPKNF